MRPVPDFRRNNPRIERRRDHIVSAFSARGTTKRTAAFGACPVVTGDIDDERVIRIGKRLDRIDDAAKVIVTMRCITCKDFHHVSVEALLIGIERVPCR
jgi:hypothetical protein